MAKWYIETKIALYSHITLVNSHSLWFFWARHGQTAII